MVTDIYTYIIYRLALYIYIIYIDITAALRAVLNIARARARAIFYISTRAPARGGDIFVWHGGPNGPECYTIVPPSRRGMISCISISGRFSSEVVMPLIR